MFRIDIPLSGMQTSQIMMNIYSNNIANVNTEGYTEKKPVLESIEGGGVRVAKIENTNSSVSLVSNLVELELASLQYRANAFALKIMLDTYGSVINMLKCNRKECNIHCY